MYCRFVIPFVSLVSLTACGGGTSNYAAGNAAFVTLGNELDDLTTRVDNLAPTELAQTPMGSASFSGVAILFEAPNLSAEEPDITFAAFGAANIEVNFDTQAVGGTVTDFIEVDVDQFTAAFNADVDIEPEDIRTANVSGTLTLDADNGTATGTLSRAAGGSASYSLATAPIDLYGANAEVVEVPAFGTANLSNGGTTPAGLLITAEQ